MLTLAAETSTQRASLALLRDLEVLSEREYEIPKGHGASLLSELSEMVTGCGLSFEQLDLLAVSAGPGSFTGLRVGLATMRALAWSLRKPVVAVPSLKTLALSAGGSSGLVAAALDARKHEIYGALFRVSGGGSEIEEILPAAVCPPASFGGAVLDAAGAERVLAVGTGVLVFGDELLGRPARFDTPRDSALHYPSARNAALLAVSLLRTGVAGRLEEALPVYVRRSEAELARPTV